MKQNNRYLINLRNILFTDLFSASWEKHIELSHLLSHVFL